RSVAMRRGCMALLLLAAAALPARAHFIWIVPDKGTGPRPTAQVVFSDGLAPDSNVPVTKIAQTELFQRGADGKEAPLKWVEGKDAYVVTLPDGQMRMVGGVCTYGVVQRGKDGPFLLRYYAKTVLGNPDAKAYRALITMTWDRFPLDIRQAPDSPALAR